MLTNSTKHIRIGIDARMYSTTATGIGRYVSEILSSLATSARNQPSHITWVIFAHPNKRHDIQQVFEQAIQA
jgi:hypothetical protein